MFAVDRISEGASRRRAMELSNTAPRRLQVWFSSLVALTCLQQTL